MSGRELVVYLSRSASKQVDDGRAETAKGLEQQKLDLASLPESTRVIPVLQRMSGTGGRGAWSCVRALRNWRPVPVPEAVMVMLVVVVLPMMVVVVEPVAEEVVVVEVEVVVVIFAKSST